VSEIPAPYHASPGGGRRGRSGRVTTSGEIDRELVRAAGIVPATRDRDGNVTTYPERLEITPVDERVFRWVVEGDRFLEGTCLTCGLHAALFVCAGRFVTLCPSCVVRRIEDLRTSLGAGEAAWFTLLDKEASRDAAYQAWKKEELYTVVFDDVWRCGRCGALIQPKDARYYHAPGQNTSRPYCEPCAVALRAGEGAGS